MAKHKLILIYILAFSICLILPIKIYAGVQVPGAQPAPPAPSPPAPADITAPADPAPAPEPEPPVYPPYSVYTPKVTSLHSINALLADSGYIVYSMPRLEDFPFSLKDAVTNSQDGLGATHQFALVYDGYFNAEVEAMNPTGMDGVDVSRFQTSKRVYELSENTRCLNLLGYDLLLNSEEIPISVSAGFVNFDYKIDTVGNKELPAATCVMDLYKAMGIYEWDVKFAYGIDPDFNANTSPILQEVDFLTSDGGEQGLDISEAKTWVAATRTNPELYWTRCTRDAIFDGGQHKTGNTYAPTDSSGHQEYRAPYVGTEVSMSASFNRGDYVTLGQFCEMARAIMTLYGEPVLSEVDRNAALQKYGPSLPMGFLTEEQYDAVMYLSAKGIIDPTDMQFQSYVTFKDIELILLRIADKDSRMQITASANMSSALTAAGYSIADVAISSDITVDIADADTYLWYDYLIKYEDAIFTVKDNTSALQIVQVDGNTNTSTEDTPADDGHTDENKLGLIQQPTEDSTVNVTTDSSFKLDYKSNPFNSANYVKLDITTNDSKTSHTKDTNLWRYYGVQKYGDEFYYHFKINWMALYTGPDAEDTAMKEIAISFDADTAGKGIQLVSGPSVPKINFDGKHNVNDLLLGGVYEREGDGWIRTPFEDADFSTEFVDFESDYERASLKLSSNNTIVAITVPSSKFTKTTLSNYKHDGPNKDLDFSNLLKSGKLASSGNISKEVTFNAFEFESDAPDYIRLEFTTPDKKLITKSKFFKDLANSGYGAQERKGYYRASDNSLLVSFKYLKEKGLATSLTPLDGDIGYTLVAGDYNTNITIFNSDSLNYIMIGDTIFGNPTGETLVEAAGGDVYINYRACIGWASDYMVVPTGEGTIMALSPTDFGNKQRKWEVTKTVDTVKTFFPSANTKTLHIKVNHGAQELGDGIALTGSYALAPYCVVMADDNGTDYLFVWHMRDVKVGTTTIVIPESKEEEAMSEFKKWTGITINKNSKYALTMIPLHRNNKHNPRGFKYVHMEKRTKAMGTQVASYGYVYNPAPFAYSRVTQALEEYAKGVLEKESENIKLAIPIFKFRGALYDANVNMCTDTPGNPLLPVGTMPGRFCSDSYTKDNQIVTLNVNGQLEVSENDAYNVNSFEIYTAPVGMFAKLKCNGEKPISEITKGAIYFGTSKVRVSGDNVVTFNNCQTSFKTNVNAICSYYGTGDSAVYVVNEDEEGNALSSVGDILAEAEAKISALYGDPDDVVDWGAYKFRRLIQNLDAWSTVVLIFVLNILPRVAIFLFLILMLLCTIRDFRGWQKVCRVFDPYSFLTWGHMTVDTIDVKKVFFISLACTCLFLIIMDGQLFNFMIWVSKLFIAYSQR